LKIRTGAVENTEHAFREQELKRALITGVTGQDGSYLAEFLLDKGPSGCVDAMGTLRLLEAARILGLEKKTPFYQASKSELYGLAQEIRLH